jgi:hypothetical protein
MAGGYRIVGEEECLKQRRKNCICRGCVFCRAQFDEAGNFKEEGCNRCFFFDTPCESSNFQCKKILHKFPLAA